MGGGRGYRQFMPCAFKIIFLFPKSSANLLISFVKDPILLLCLIKLFFNKQCPKIEIINVTERSRSWLGDVRLREDYKIRSCSALSYFCCSVVFPK